MHPYFTEEEIKRMRDGLNRRRVPGTYEPGKWDVSHQNRRSETLVAPFPKHVTLRDITLRVIQQTPVVSVTREERLRLAEALIEAGVTSLQIGHRSQMEDPKPMIEEIRALRSMGYQDIELTSGGALNKAQIDSVANTGLDVLNLQNPAVPEMTPLYFKVFRPAWRGEDWRKECTSMNAEEQTERTASLVAYAKQKGLKPSPCVNMLAYAQDDYLRAYAKAMEEAGAYYILLADGSSGLGPDACRHVVSVVKKAVSKCKVGAHVHNAFGLGVANCLAAIQGGADVVEVAMNNLCSASGQACTAEVAVALEVLYGVNTGIKLEKLTGLRRLVEDITRIPMAQMKPVTGERAWMYTSDWIWEELKVEPLFHYSLEPEVVGNRKLHGLGQYAGNWSVWDKLQELGVDIDRALVPEVVNLVKAELLIRRRELTDEEVKEVAERVKARA